MCGIAGIMTADGRAPDHAVLDALTAALGHRGPDGQGRLLAGPVGLVHTRLSIIDLESGDQPLFGPNDTALIGNGEIYNYRELRDRLPGVTWLTRSDCEPPLYLYDRHGLDFTEHLRGMYALAIHDPRHDRLVLARDPFGIKPLYIAEMDNGVAFASEPRALVAAGLVVPAVDATARDEMAQLQFSCGRATALAGIDRVLPGETVVIENGRVTGRRRRSALPDGRPRRLPADEALTMLDNALEDSVAMHQRADVPYGMFLSGGIDSSALLAMMARLNPDNPVLAFTAGFPGTGAHDERDHARALAARVGAEHVEVDVTEADFWSLLPGVAAAMDDPAADYATLPTYKLAKEAAKSVKVVLAGEGGDELFAGYGRYRKATRRLVPKRMRRRGTFDGLDEVLRARPRHWRAGIEAAETAADAKAGWTPLQRVQAVDMADWLPHDLLVKLDRCLMAHGVEGRVPFLDPVVAELAFALPDRLKVRGKTGKWLLRRWLDTVLPEAQPFSKKRGFTVPVGEWIGARGETLGPLVAAEPGVAEMCDPAAVGALFKRAGTDKRTSFAAWTLLFYALWHRRHVLGLAAEGDVFDTLGRP